MEMYTTETIKINGWVYWIVWYLLYESISLSGYGFFKILDYFDKVVGQDSISLFHEWGESCSEVSIDRFTESEF